MSIRLPAAALCLVLACAGCRHASSPDDRHGPRPLRQVRLPSGLTMSPALAILDLGQDERYRWAEPDSLVGGLTSEDAASVGTPAVLDLRESVATVLRANGWRLSPDSADFDLAVFVVSRTEMVRETRAERTTTALTGLPRCDASLGPNQPRCTNSPVNSRNYEVSVPVVVRRVFHVVRRRADGATKVWVNPVENLPAVDASVARDLMRLFISRDG